MSSGVSTITTPLREDLIANAVEFLLDKSIASSPLAKKIEFIESKGLTQEEIQEALTRSQNGNKASNTTAATQTTSTTSAAASNLSTPPPPPPLPDYYYNAPPLPQRDWKDYFVMATATAGVSYGIYQIVKRYIVPKILPPSKTAIENDKESISLEFQRIEELLNTFEQQQKDFYEKQESKAEKIDQTLTDIDEIINKTNEKNLNNEETLKYLKLEIENIKNTLMKSLDSQKSTITQELTNLETDLNDLKFQLKNLNISSIKSSSHLSTPPTEANNAASTTATTSDSVSQNTTTTVPSLNLNIPPATSIPSLKDILQKEKERSISESDIAKYARETSQTLVDSSSSTTNTSPEPQVSDSTNSNKKKGIPAWQLAA